MLSLMYLLTVFQSFCSKACMNSVTISFALFTEDSFFCVVYFLVGDRFIPSLGPAFDLGKLIFKLDVNHFLDSKDFHMFVALYNNARLSYASLGRRVSLSAPAVRDRLNHLKKNGILQGFMLSIDPSVFDRDDLLL